MQNPPLKPKEGDACNGCGLCCIAERCSFSELMFGDKPEPCPALVWGDFPTRAYCGLVVEPDQYVDRAISVGLLPSKIEGVILDGTALSMFVELMLGVGRGCDASDDDYILELQDALQRVFKLEGEDYAKAR